MVDQHKILPRATPHQRYQAQKIIKALRDQYSCGQVAEVLGICRAYVSCIEHKTRRYENNEMLSYYAPSWAIFRVLEKK